MSAPEYISGDKTFNNNVVIRGELWVEKINAGDLVADIPLATDSIVGGMKIDSSTTVFYLDGSGTLQTTLSGGGDMLRSNNLSDVLSVSAARSNLNVYSKSEVYNKTEADGLFLTESSNANINGNWGFSNSVALNGGVSVVNDLSLISTSGDVLAKPTLGSFCAYHADTIKFKTESFGASIIGTQDKTVNSNLSYIRFSDNSGDSIGSIGDSSTGSNDIYLASASGVGDVVLKSGTGGNHSFGSNFVGINGAGNTDGTLSVRQRGTTSSDGLSLFNGVGGSSCRIYHDGNDNLTFARINNEYFKLTTTGQFATNDFTNTSFTGQGISLDQDGLGAFDNLSVRGTFKAYAFEVDEIRANNGALWISNGAKLNRDATSTSIYMDKETCEPSPFINGDICQVQVWDKTNNTIKKVVIKITSNYALSGDGVNVFHDYVIIEGVYTDLTDGSSIVRVDSAVVNRRNSLYLTASDNNSPFMDVVRGDGTGVFNSYMRTGELSGLSGQSGIGIWGSSDAVSTAFVISSDGYAKIANWNFNNQSLYSGTEFGVANSDMTFSTKLNDYRIRSKNFSVHSDGTVTVNGTITIQNPSDINTNDITNGAGWTDDTTADIANATANDAFAVTDNLTTFSTITSSKFEVSADVNNFIRIFFNNASDWGLRGDVAGETLLKLGSGVNSIAGWNFDKEAIWTGTKKTTDGFTTGGITLSTVGNGSLRSPKFELRQDGSAFFSGELSAATGSFSGNVSASSGNFGTFSIVSGGLQGVSSLDSLDKIELTPNNPSIRIYSNSTSILEFIRTNSLGTPLKTFSLVSDLDGLTFNGTLNLGDDFYHYGKSHVTTGLSSNFASATYLANNDVIIWTGSASSTDKTLGVGSPLSNGKTLFIVNTATGDIEFGTAAGANYRVGSKQCRVFVYYNSGWYAHVI